MNVIDASTIVIVLSSFWVVGASAMCPNYLEKTRAVFRATAIIAMVIAATLYPLALYQHTIIGEIIVASWAATYVAMGIVTTIDCARKRKRLEVL